MLDISLSLLSQPLFASVGQASTRIIDSLTWSLFISLWTHRLVLLCVDAYCFILWDVPGDVLAAPESPLCGLIGVILLSLSLFLTMINRDVDRFWDLLTDFCVLDAAPLSWQCTVAVAHPFIIWNNS